MFEKGTEGVKKTKRPVQVISVPGEERGSERGLGRRGMGRTCREGSEKQNWKTQLDGGDWELVALLGSSRSQ